MQFSLKHAAIATAAAGMALAASHAMAMGGASGANVTYAVQGNIGEVVWNPHKIAPLTAVIRNGGYEIKNAKVRIVPKANGQEIKYDVSRRQILTHGGIPVFGLYPDYLNTVEVEYDRVYNGKTEHFQDRYQFYAPPVYTMSNGTPMQSTTMFNAKPEIVKPGFEDRLYLIDNQLYIAAPQGGRFVWNNPTGGALEWAFNSEVGIIDTKGETRWYLLASLINDTEDPWSSGFMMGFQQAPDGALTWGFGQRYVKYDLIGRKIWDRRLPSAYADYSHAFDNMQNGNSLLRVSSADYRRADGKRVHTVRDVIIEVDKDGGVVDEWKLMEILDPYRADVIKVLDQGAVCLNIDASKAGQTLSAEDLAKQEAEGQFGDVAGVGPGRNWAHVNSVDYDPTDDSIIISSRHQSAAIKIGRDKKVKWIMGSPEGWSDKFKDKVLTPVDAKGNKIKCEGSKCEGGFDWSWTQHTAWRIDKKSTKDVIYITVFDNGDARGMEQPALAEEKYTRGVIYKIDQKKMTVEQVWEVGKEYGHDAFSPVTGLAQYQEDKDSVVVYYSTAGLTFDLHAGGGAANGNIPDPWICEYRWGETEPSVKINFTDAFGYQAFPISLEKAFSQN